MKARPGAPPPRWRPSARYMGCAPTSSGSPSPLLGPPPRTVVLVGVDVVAVGAVVADAVAVVVVVVVVAVVVAGLRRVAPGVASVVGWGFRFLGVALLPPSVVAVVVVVGEAVAAALAVVVGSCRPRRVLCSWPCRAASARRPPASPRCRPMSFPTSPLRLLVPPTRRPLAPLRRRPVPSRHGPPPFLSAVFFRCPHTLWLVLLSVL